MYHEDGVSERIRAPRDEREGVGRGVVVEDEPAGGRAKREEPGRHDPRAQHAGEAECERDGHVESAQLRPAAAAAAAR